MEERVFGDDYCEGVYHGRLDGDENKYRLEKFEDNWYIADGTGNVDAVILIDKHISISISDFYPDARITVHLFVIENLRQGAVEVRDERDDHVAGLQERILELQRDNQCHLENEVKYLDEIDTIQASYKKLVQMQKGAVTDFLDLRKARKLEGIDYQEEIDDLENVLGIVKKFNEDLAAKLTQAKGRYNDLSMKLHDCVADQIDLDKRNMGLVGRCQELEEEVNKLERRHDEMTIIPRGGKVAMDFAFEQYAKVQDYVLANKLCMGHDDDATHADILISEHGYLFTKIQTIRNAAGLKNA